MKMISLFTPNSTQTSLFTRPGNRYMESNSGEVCLKWTRDESLDSDQLKNSAASKLSPKNVDTEISEDSEEILQSRFYELWRQKLLALRKSNVSSSDKQRLDRYQAALPVWPPNSPSNFQTSITKKLSFEPSELNELNTVAGSKTKKKMKGNSSINSSPLTSSIDTDIILTSQSLTDSSEAERLTVASKAPSLPSVEAPYDVDEAMAKEHFPITLSAQLSTSSISNSSFKNAISLHNGATASKLSAREGCSGHLNQITSPHNTNSMIAVRDGASSGRNKIKRSRSTHDRPHTARRLSSGQSSSCSTSRSSLDKIYLFNFHSTSDQGGNMILSATPYQAELERLRMERLRIEEGRLLEERDRLETERARPPIDRWYELKSSQFHYEFRKHNARLRISPEVASTSYRSVNAV